MPLLKVPTESVIITLCPSGKVALPSRQAGRSVPPLLGAVIASPHSDNCQITPARGPTIWLNQAGTETFGNTGSRAEAGVRCTKLNACCSSDCCGMVIIQKHNTIAIAKAFISLLIDLERTRVINNGQGAV